MTVDLTNFSEALAEKPLFVSATRHAQCQRVFRTNKRSLSDISTLIAIEPSLCMSVLRYINRIRARSENPLEITSIPSAVNLLGENALQTLIASVGVLEKKVKDDQIINSYYRLLDQCIHAAQFSKKWAQIRKDGAPGELEVAALLRNIGELALCLHHHEKYLEIQKLSIEQRISTAQASINILGFSTLQLSARLAQHWYLPDVVRDGIDTSQWHLYRPQGVMLASECARLAEFGWYHRDMFVCKEAIASHLNIGLDQCCTDTHKLTLAIARSGMLNTSSLFAARLVDTPYEIRDQSTQRSIETNVKVQPAKKAISEIDKVRKQRARIYTQTIQQIKTRTASGGANAIDLLKMMMDGLNKGLNLQRVVFVRYDAKQQNMAVKLARGIDSAFAGKINFSCENGTLFSSLLKTPKSIQINADNFVKFKPLIPETFSEAMGTQEFMCTSLFCGDRPIGLIYSDCVGSNVKLDKSMYHNAKSLILFTGKAITAIDSRKYETEKSKVSTEVRPKQPPVSNATNVKKMTPAPAQKNLLPYKKNSPSLLQHYSEEYFSSSVYKFCYPTNRPASLAQRH